MHSACIGQVVCSAPLPPVSTLQTELQRRKEAALRAESKCVDKKRMEALRKSFLEKVLSYTGVPYARRYHQPTCKPPRVLGLARLPLARILACAPCPPTPSSHLPLQIVSGLLRSGAPGAAGSPGGVWIRHRTREPGLPGSQGEGLLWRACHCCTPHVPSSTHCQ